MKIRHFLCLFLCVALIIVLGVCTTAVAEDYSSDVLFIDLDQCVVYQLTSIYDPSIQFPILTFEFTGDDNFYIDIYGSTSAMLGYAPSNTLYYELGGSNDVLYLDEQHIYIDVYIDITDYTDLTLIIPSGDNYVHVFKLARTDWSFSYPYQYGYQDGYYYALDQGYNQGYQQGYDDGVNTSVGDLFPFRALVEAGNSFFLIEPFGNGVNIGMLLGIPFGCILLGLAIKMFLGG